ncbi:uncharacterized protein LOC143218554 [Lasioglossum baleicum]|uniref:uncharacterized protein LOC143218554 n=1 Tax=Lasioglossum baleicum TaxID=434251 RepID=UPI003FCE0641
MQLTSTNSIHNAHLKSIMFQYNLRTVQLELALRLGRVRRHCLMKPKFGLRLLVRRCISKLSGDLTTDSFIGALKRFISRRGKIISLHSDNGIAFTGAARELKELHEFLESQISWHFIPPNAPHFGGLWEAAVKSAKFHMHRVMGYAHLTYEEVQTLFSEIEAIFNSRPITPLSEDPNDMACLTPGHFLIGEELNSFPREDLSGLNENRLSRWQRVEQLRQHFWSRWSREYLSQLQEKSKWRTNKGSQLQLGQLVLVKQQGLAPLQWIMGRVQEIHPGPDDVVRAASIKTLKGIITRPLAKLAILPIET